MLGLLWLSPTPPISSFFILSVSLFTLLSSVSLVFLNFHHRYLLCLSHSFDLPVSMLTVKLKTKAHLTYSQSKSFKMNSWNPFQKNYSEFGDQNCLVWRPTSTELWACQMWRWKGCRGAAAVGADVLPNCTCRHAETILFNCFKASAMGVTARLNQL